MNQETYEAAKEFPYVSGFDFRTDHYLKLQSSKNWRRVEVDNVQTLVLYNHFNHSHTISLPLYTPSFSKTLVIDIDKQDISPNIILDQLEEDLGKAFYIERKNNTGNTGIHAYFEFKSEIFTQTKKYLENYYLAKYGYKIESNLQTIRLPFSKAYHKNARDNNNFEVNTPTKLVNLFGNRHLTPLEIPKFLKEVNKHGTVLPRIRLNNLSTFHAEQQSLISSYGNRIQPQLLTARLAVSENKSFEEFCYMCDDLHDGTSKDMNGTSKYKILKKIYDWEVEHHNKDIEVSTVSAKPTEFLNKSEFAFDDEQFDIFNKILKHTTDLSKTQKFDALIMMEAIISIFDYNETNPTKNYEEALYQPLNNGVPIAMSTIKLIADKYQIKNYRKIWKTIKDIFLKPIELSNGYTYSYCNIRFAIHYMLLDLKNLLSTIYSGLNGKLISNNLLKYIKKILISKNYWYNICCNINNNTPVPQIANNYLIRPD